MKRPTILVSRTDISLNDSPIDAAWIVDGSPAATSRVLSRSSDGSAITVVWECTPGVFTWRYDVEETVHLLEGRVTLTDGSRTRAIGAGDVVFFPAGTEATWRVEERVRKLAFFHHTLPRPLQFVSWIYYKLRVSGIFRRLRAAGRGIARILDGVAPRRFKGARAKIGRLMAAQSTSAW